MSNSRVGSSLVASLVDRSKILIPPKPSKFKMPKAAKVPSPKADTMTEETKEAIHPFILEHRVGTTERVTSMDPMSEGFIRSLRIPYKGKYSNKAVPSTEQIPAGILTALIQTKISTLMQEAVPGTAYITALPLTDLGRPWKADGWIDPSFRISTACVLNRPGRTVAFSASKVLMECWRYREPDFVCSIDVSGRPVRATLVNKFEAVTEKLICYSFIMKYDAEKDDVVGGMQDLVHVWVNATYSANSGRSLPMYFEEAGAYSFILNAVTACLGLEIDATGDVALLAEGKVGVRRTALNKNQCSTLQALNVLVDFGKVVNSGIPPAWGAMSNVDWQGIGFELQPGGVVWNASVQTSHLPWQVQAHRVKSNGVFPASIRRTFGVVGGSLGGARALFELSPSARKPVISKSVGQLFWNNLKTNDDIDSFDSAIRELRTEYLTDELIDEMKKLDETVSATELFDATYNSSDKLGRFVFERSLPGYVKPVAVEARVETVEARETSD
jgi:hypothetical protein